MISICDNNSICDITNLKDNNNKRGLVIPVILKIRKPLYNIKTKINIEDDNNIQCSGEGCIDDKLMDIFLFGKKENEKSKKISHKTKKNKQIKLKPKSPSKSTTKKKKQKKK